MLVGLFGSDLERLVICVMYRNRERKLKHQLGLSLHRYSLGFQNWTVGRRIQSQLERTDNSTSDLHTCVVEVTDTGWPGEPRTHLLDISPFSTPSQISFELFFSVPVLDQNHIGRVILIRLDTNRIATIKSTSVMKLVPHE